MPGGAQAGDHGGGRGRAPAAGRTHDQQRPRGEVHRDGFGVVGHAEGDDQVVVEARRSDHYLRQRPRTRTAPCPQPCPQPCPRLGTERGEGVGLGGGGGIRAEDGHLDLLVAAQVAAAQLEDGPPGQGHRHAEGDERIGFGHAQHQARTDRPEQRVRQVGPAVGGQQRVDPHLAPLHQEALQPLEPVVAGRRVQLGAQRPEAVDDHRDAGHDRLPGTGAQRGQGLDPVLAEQRPTALHLGGEGVDLRGRGVQVVGGAHDPGVGQLEQRQQRPAGEVEGHDLDLVRRGRRDQGRHRGAQRRRPAGPAGAEHGQAALGFEVHHGRSAGLVLGVVVEAQQHRTP